MSYPLSTYLQNEILTAPSERLVQILYEIAYQAVKSARECLSAKDVPGRVRHINRAFAAFVELNDGLDFEAGKDIAINYARIYDYCRRRLIGANVAQDDAILAEVEGLISELQESWQIVVCKLSAERTAKFASSEILPSEEALAGRLSLVG